MPYRKYSSFVIALPTSSFLNISSPLFLGVMHGFPLDCMYQIEICCCSQINPVLLEKYLAICLFKVNINENVKNLFTMYMRIKFFQMVSFSYTKKSTPRPKGISGF